MAKASINRGDLLVGPAAAAMIHFRRAADVCPGVSPLQAQEDSMTTSTTNTAPPEWLLAFWSTTRPSVKGSTALRRMLRVTLALRIFLFLEE
jgi:hypothetical protein